MSCRRANGIDVESFLIESADPRFEEFRAHYPDCPDCSEAVAGWSAFEDALAAGFAAELAEDSGHPSGERLAEFIRTPELAGAAGTAISSHLERCAPCQSEAALLARFDAEALDRATTPVEATAERMASATDRQPAEADASVFDAIRDLLSDLTSSLFAPGLTRAAVPAMLVVLAAFGVLMMRGNRPDTESSPPVLAQSPPPDLRDREAIRSEPFPTAEAVPGSEEATDTSLADGSDTLPGAPRPSAPEANTTLPPEASTGQIARKIPTEAPDEPTQLAERSDPVAPPSPRSVPPVPSPRDADLPAPDPIAPNEEEMLLASLDDFALPRYAAQDRGNVDWMRLFDGNRATVPGGVPIIEALAPQDHVGRTLERAPRIWWSLDRPNAFDLVVTVTTAEAIEPIFEKRFPGPQAAGLDVLDLAQEGVRLEPGVDYRWFVVLEADPNRPSRNPVATGALRVVEASDPRRAAIAQRPRFESGHALAENGIWYDALDFFATIARAHPESKAAAHRDGLLESSR